MTYRQVRSLTRGLAVLNALATRVSATPVDLAATTGIHRTTIKRLLVTLCEEGYVRVSPSDGKYRLRLRAVSLFAHSRSDIALGEVAAPVLADLVRTICWPSELAVPAGGEMSFAKSTHRQSPVAITPSTVGNRYPMMSSALGQAYLSFGDKATQVSLTAQLRAEDRAVDRGADRMGDLIARTRRLGYAECVCEDDPKLASIALPVRYAGRVSGSIGISYFKSAMRPADAAERCLPGLREAVRRIEMSAMSMEPSPVVLPV